MTVTDDRVASQEQAAEARWLAAWLAGPARTRWTDLPPQLGDPAPDLALADPEGRVRRLSEFWRGRPVLVLFLRHFGCSCLAERWDRLKAELPAYEAAGAGVVTIVQAEPERTRAVAQRRGYPFALLCDPERAAHARYGVLEGTAAQILHDFPWKPNDWQTGEQLLASRRGTERALMDDPWQLPAEFLVTTDGRIAHAHRAQYCEDSPPMAVLLGAIRAAKDANSAA